MTDKQAKRSRGKAEPESNPRETEACLGDVSCSKNPDHSEFIPVRKFGVHHLPKNLPGRQVVHDRIKAALPLVVHLSVGHVSENRPAVYPDTGDPYPFWNSRGKSVYRTGSGFVDQVTKCGGGGQRDVRRTCGCHECVESGRPKTTWWEVGVVTSSHVTFDLSEVTDTVVRFFHDEKGSTRFVCKGDKCYSADVLGDRCEFSVILHDDDVGEKLKTALKKTSAVSSGRKQVPDDVVVVISHPHGLSKHVTVGRSAAEEAYTYLVFDPLTYTSATCPGSSGGMVLWARWVGDNHFYRAWHPHSEAFPDGINRSGCFSVFTVH